MRVICTQASVRCVTPHLQHGRRFQSIPLCQPRKGALRCQPQQLRARCSQLHGLEFGQALIRRGTIARPLRATDGGEEPSETKPKPQLADVASPLTFTLTTVVVYACCTGLAAGLVHWDSATFAGTTGIVASLLQLPPIAETALWTVPLLISLTLSVLLADRIPALKEVKTLFSQSGITPLLSRMPTGALLVLALSAGIGEEALFRGWLQPLLSSKAAALGAELGGLGALGQAELIGLAVTSVVFGALHAVTPLYFFWATGAGALFGMEYIATGGNLAACAFTHALYDWIAFAAIVRFWGKAQ